MKKNDDYTSGRLQVSIFKKYWPLFWWNGIQIWITVHKQDVAPFSFLSGKKPTVDDQCNALFSCQMFILYAACKYIGFRRKRTEAYMLQSAFFILCDWFFRQKLHTILTLYGRTLLFGNIVSLKPLYIFENCHEEIVKYSIIKMTYFSTNLYTLTIEKCFCS